MNYFVLGVLGFIVGLSGAMLPGPMLIYTISKVMQGSVISGIKIVFGHMLVEVVAVALILLGLKEIMDLRIVSALLSLIGGLALVTIGLYIILKAGNMKLSKGSQVNFSSGLIAGGIFFTAFNPTFPTWWATIGASLLFKALLSGLIGVVILTIGHWLADFAWFGFVSFTVCKGKRLLNSRRYQIVLRILGISLVIFSIYFWINK